MTDWLADVELPTEQEEDWRYSRIADLRPERFTPATAGDAPASVPESLKPVLDAIGDSAAVVVVADGGVGIVNVDGSVTGLVVRTGDAGSPIRDIDAFSALNARHSTGAVIVEIDRGATVEKPVVVLEDHEKAGLSVFPRVTVRAGEASEATVVHYSTSSDRETFVDSVVELDAGPAANLSYVSVQALGRSTWQTGYVLSRAARDATIREYLVALGGEYARSYVHAEMADQGSSTAILGVYFGDGDQEHDFRSVQLHDAPGGTSDFLLKGAVVDAAHGIYTGVIRIEEGARGTDAFLTNRNLVLSDGAHVDSVPNLEIENENDLKSCGHAAATGPVDEEHLFYLESRGVPEDVAEQLVVFGFFDDIVGRVPIGGLRDFLRDAVSAKLRRAGVEARA